MSKEYKTAFMDDFKSIAILIVDKQGNPEAFKVPINGRKAKRLKEYFEKKAKT